MKSQTVPPKYSPEKPRPITGYIDLNELDEQYIEHRMNPATGNMGKLVPILAFKQRDNTNATHFIVQRIPMALKEQGMRGPIVGSLTIKDSDGNCGATPERQERPVEDRDDRPQKSRYAVGPGVETNYFSE